MGNAYNIKIDKTRWFVELGVRPYPLQENKKSTLLGAISIGADYGARTRHLHLGKVALYQMS